MALAQESDVLSIASMAHRWEIVVGLAPASRCVTGPSGGKREVFEGLPLLLRSF